MQYNKKRRLFFLKKTRICPVSLYIYVYFHFNVKYFVQYMRHETNENNTTGLNRTFLIECNFIKLQPHTPTTDLVYPKMSFNV